jgi:hypothetical protein
MQTQRWEIVRLLTIWDFLQGFGPQKKPEYHLKRLKL